MRDEQHHRPRRRLFQHFEDGIGGLGVEVVRRIDNHHPAPTVRRGEGKEITELAHFGNTNFGSKTVALVGGSPPQQKKPRIRQRQQTPRHRMIRGDVQRFRWWWCTKEPLLLHQRCGQQEPRNAPRKRRLAHATRPGDQPAVMQPPGVERIEKLGLCRGLANKLYRLARMWRPLYTVRFG